MAEPGKLTLAAMGDLHVDVANEHPYRQTFAEISDKADVLALCGDLTNFGRVREAEILAEELRAATIPVVGVLGNHDFESGHLKEVAQILRDGGMTLLDKQAVEIDGVGFAGVKGFIGGFGRGELGSFGEPAIKAFVEEGLNEARKLENALRTLRTDRAVVVLHYSPIPDTVEGEPLEIYPFLGSSRLAEPIDRFENVRLAVHGHAHRGRYEGRTLRGVPVYNCSIPVLEALFGRPYTLLEV
ncbi:MAG TPA: metallophosphoesterase [Sphingomicrobium sp.]